MAIIYISNAAFAAFIKKQKKKIELNLRYSMLRSP